MSDNTHPLQRIAARAHDRATGRRMRFVPAGVEDDGFRIVASFTPNPVTRFPDGSMMIGEEPVMFVSAGQLEALGRDPRGGNSGPDFVNVHPGVEGNRRVMSAQLGHNGFWKLTISNPVA